MFGIDTDSAVASEPSRPVAATPGFFTDGDPATQVLPTILPAWYMNMLQKEVLAVLTAASISPDKTNDGQLAAAIIALATGSAAVVNDNLLINGGFSINQRGLTSVTDGNYDFDRWYALLQSGAVAPSQLTDPETGAPFGARYTQSQASAQRIGRAQVVESAACRHLRGAQVTFSGRARMSVSTNLRFALCEWTGTADSVTRDIVNDWTNGTYTGGNFFISSNLNVLAVGQLVLIANTWAPFTLSHACGASMNNLFVFAWTESTQAQNVTLDFDSCKLEPGASATVFRPRLPALELELCQRFYEKSFPLGTAPVQNGGSAGAITAPQVVTASNSMAFQTIRYRTAKRGNPTVTLYNPSSTNGQIRDVSTNHDWSGTAITNASAEGFTASGLTPGTSFVGDSSLVHFTAEAEI